jgi:2-dehydropantoate 2-reductase
MKVCVVGAGAIGGWIGAWLVQSGHDVSLVARGAHLEAIQSRGLAFTSGGRSEALHVAASDRPADLGEQDAVFITLKAYSIGPMLPTLRPILRPDTLVIPAINGIPWWYFYREGGAHEGSAIACLDPDGSMLGDFDSQHLIGCVVHGSAEVSRPGSVNHNAGNHLIVGEPDNSASPRVDKLAEVLRGAGFEVTVSTEIRRDIWMKLIGNLSYNPVAALTLARMNEINANEGILDLLRAMMEEAMQVSEAYGITVGMTVDERIEVARKIGSAKISMHQDVERGKPLEVEAIVGSVVELARRAGVATPMIDAVYALVGERARHLGDG